MDGNVSVCGGEHVRSEVSNYNNFQIFWFFINQNSTIENINLAGGSKHVTALMVKNVFILNNYLGFNSQFQIILDLN